MRSGTGWLACLPVALLVLLFIVVTTNVANASITFLNAWGSQGDAEGQFRNPWGVAVDDAWDGNASGAVYVADTGNHRMQQFDGEGSFVAAWGGYGPLAGECDLPTGSAVSAAGKIYVADMGNHRIQEVSSDGNATAWWYTGGSPAAVAVSSLDEVYVANSGSDRIQKFDTAGSLILEWTSNLDLPRGIAVSSSGAVYVADTGHHRMQKFDGEGNFVAAWGSYGQSTGQLYLPAGVAVNLAGEVYVADTGNDRIQKFDSTGSFVSAWGGHGTGNGQFDVPRGIAVSPSGEVYVADAGNDRIERFFDTDAWYRGPYLLSDSVAIGAGEPLGSLLSITGNRSIEILGTTTIRSDGQLDLVGGTFITGTLIRDLNGTINIASGTLHITGPAGLVVENVLGSYLRLGPGAHLKVDNTTTLLSGGVLELDGGTFATDLLRIESGAEFRCGSSYTNVGEVQVLGESVTISGNFVNEGVVQTGIGSHLVFAGCVSGSGSFLGGGTWEIVDCLAPGSSPAKIAFEGDLVIGSSAKVIVELEGTDNVDPLAPQYDSIAVTGSVILGGTLDLDLAHGFAPGLGDTFNIVTAAAGISGEFSTFDNTDAPLGLAPGGRQLAWLIEYSFYGVDLLVGLRGDVNGDGFINDLDIAPFIDMLLRGEFHVAADMNGDHTVNGLDVDLFVDTVGGAKVQAVAEPSSIFLLSIALLGLAQRAWRHRQKDA